MDQMQLHDFWKPFLILEVAEQQFQQGKRQLHAYLWSDLFQKEMWQEDLRQNYISHHLIRKFSWR